MAAPRLTSLLLSSRRLVLLPRPALAAPRHLATSPVRAEYFFTKKHEWVNVEGDKGEHFYKDITLLPRVSHVPVQCINAIVQPSLGLYNFQCPI